jgi:tyrosyl-tRNA synthetase
MGISELTRNAVDVLPEGELERKLALGRPLRVKFGIDVTAPDVTLGNGIPLQRMAAFQREGHTGVLIVGDYTTRIGDPSGRSATRPILSDEEIDLNAKRFVAQASTIVDPERTEVRFNGEWLAKLDFTEILRLTRTTTVARLLEREDFAKRFAAKTPISVSELLYPLMQAYDSVAVEADVELGGTDQLYNLLMGREVLQAYGIQPQVALTVEYLASWDGNGMSASRGNYIGLTEPPEEQFGKTMRIPDTLLPQWYRLIMEISEDPLAGDPLEAKLRLARFIVTRAHGKDAARRAEEHFTRVVREGRAPEDVAETPVPEEDPVHLPRLLADQFGMSTSEARRLIAQGGIRLDGTVVTDLDLPRSALEGGLLQAGKRRFVRLTPV